jgi:hypothetical protein
VRDYRPCTRCQRTMLKSSAGTWSKKDPDHTYTGLPGVDHGERENTGATIEAMRASRAQPDPHKGFDETWGGHDGQDPVVPEGPTHHARAQVPHVSKTAEVVGK